MDGGHQTFSDSEVLVKNFGDGGKAVGGAGGVRNDVLFGVVVPVVNSVHVGGAGLVLRGGGEDDLLRTTLQMHSALFDLQEGTGAFTDDIDASVTPLDGSGILLGVDSDFLSVDDDALLPFLNGEGESQVSRVVLELVDEVVDVHEGVVDSSNDGLLVVFEDGPDDQSSNTSESVDT
jgi:hypothetical protein